MNDRHHGKPHDKHMIKVMMKCMTNCMIGNKDKMQAKTNDKMPRRRFGLHLLSPHCLASVCGSPPKIVDSQCA